MYLKIVERAWCDLLIAKMNMALYKRLCINGKKLAKISYNDFSADAYKIGDVQEIPLPFNNKIYLKLDKKIDFEFELLPYQDCDGYIDEVLDKYSIVICKGLEKNIKEDIKKLRVFNKKKRLCFSLQNIETTYCIMLNGIKSNTIRFVFIYGLDFVDTLSPLRGWKMILKEQRIACREKIIANKENCYSRSI